MPDSRRGMWRPPVNRAMRELDRRFFQKNIPISAARIFDTKQISRCRKDLEKSRDVLPLERITIIRPDPQPELARIGRKCLLLKDGILHDDPSTWSSTVHELVRSNHIGLIPFELQLDYDYWTYHDIMSSILPVEEQQEIPSGFTIVGQVAHLNLRDQYLQYKHLIAEVLLDKNPQIKTVINKIENVGTEDPFRTFPYEVLAGPDDLNVEISEENCIFKFDYARVYWNSRLNTEHRRLVDLFQPGDAVCDVMAGIGPFAVPAGKRGVFVYANDLNPHSYRSLEDAIRRNKASDFVSAFNEDGREFIRTAAQMLLETSHTVKIYGKKPRGTDKTVQAPLLKTVERPHFFSHYVMNLPATAITFLPSFIGLYASLAQPPGSNDNLSSLRLPMIHVYAFSTKSDDNVIQSTELCEEVMRQLQMPSDDEATIAPGIGETNVFDVRDVAPKKRMFCVSFRLPRSVAWRKT